MKAKEMRKTRRIGLSTLTVALLGVAAAVFVIVGAFSFVAVYGQAMTADTSTRAEQATRQTAAALENYLHNMEEKLDRIAAEVTDESLTDTGELDVAVRLYTDVEAVMLWRRDGSLAVCSAGGRKVKTQAAGSLSFDARAFDSAEDFAISLPHVGNLYEDYYPWVVTLTRRMDPAVFGSDMAIAVDFSFSGIAQYIDNVGFGRHGYCYVIDRDGEMVYHPQQQMLYAGIREENVDEMTALEDGAHVFDDAIRTVSTLSDGWRVVGVSYTDELAASRRQAVVRFVAAVLLCCVLIAAATVLLYARIVNRPVNRLVRAMQDFERAAETYAYTGADEPFYQGEFALALLQAAKAEGIATAVETCGMAKTAYLEAAVGCTDVFLYDIKESSPARHRQFTGADNVLILYNLDRIASMGACIVLRAPIIPGVNDREEHFANIGAVAERYAAIRSVEVLPYHRAGGVKYANVGMTATQFAVPTPEDARRYVAAIAAHTNKNVKLA